MPTTNLQIQRMYHRSADASVGHREGVARSRVPELGRRVGPDRLPVSLVLFMATLPLQGIVFDVGISLNLNYIAAGVLVLANLGTLLRIRPSQSDHWFIAFLISAAVSAFNGLQYSGAAAYLDGTMRYSTARQFIHFGRLVLWFLVYLMIANQLAGSWPRIRSFLKMSLTIAFIVCCYGAYQFIGSLIGLPFVFVTNVRPGLSSAERFAGQLTARFALPQIQATFVEPKDFSWYLNMMIFVGLAYYYMAKQRGHKDGALRLALIGVIVMVCEMALSFNRSGYVVFLAQAVIAGLLISRLRSRLLTVAAVFLAFVSVAMVLLTGSVVSGISEYVASFGKPTETAAYYQGVEGLVWPLIQEAPLLGYGPGGLAFAAATVSRPERWSQDTLDGIFLHTSLLGGTGVLGTLLFVGGLVSVALSMMRTWREVKRGRRLCVPVEAFGFVSVALLGVWLRMSLQAIWSFPVVWVTMSIAAAMVRTLRTSPQSEFPATRRRMSAC